MEERGEDGVNWCPGFPQAAEDLEARGTKLDRKGQMVRKGEASRAEGNGCYASTVPVCFGATVRWIRSRPKRQGVEPSRIPRHRARRNITQNGVEDGQRRIQPSHTVTGQSVAGEAWPEKKENQGQEDFTASKPVQYGWDV